MRLNEDDDAHVITRPRQRSHVAVEDDEEDDDPDHMRHDEDNDHQSKIAIDPVRYNMIFALELLPNGKFKTYKLTRGQYYWKNPNRQMAKKSNLKRRYSANKVPKQAKVISLINTYQLYPSI